MNNKSAISYFLALALIFSIGSQAFAEEQCSNKEKSDQKLSGQDFGFAFSPDDFLTSMMSPFMFRDYYRPWVHLAQFHKDLGSTIKTDKDQFQINVDVQHFAPDEITVKTADGYVVIEAKHEEKKDEHGFVSRQFVRRYALPEGTESDAVVSQLSSDGVLTVSAPRKSVDGERVVPITKTGPVRKEAKEESCASATCSKPSK